VAPNRSPWRSEAGVILLERLLAVALAGLVAAATMFLWQKQQETYFRGSEAAQVQQDTRAALELVARDLRQARTVSTADTGRIVFQSAADADPAPQRTFDLGSGSGCARLCVRYDLGDGAGAQPIADGIVAGGLQFTYRDVGGSVLAAVPLSATDRLRIRQVDITLVGQMVLTDPDPPFTFATSVKLRNR
jgi:type II secretory pathway pseudopilin PulG